MSEICLNAPIQNTNFDPDDKPGKIIPLGVANWIRDQEGMSPSRIDLWNSACSGYDTRDDAKKGLTQKYHSRLITSMGGSALRQVSTDIDNDFEQWCMEIVEDRINHGGVSLEIRSVFACQQCHNIITLSEASRPLLCTSCKSVEIDREDRRVLTSRIDTLAIKNTARATNGIFDQASYPPHVSILNKKRPVGISLERIGLSDDVLDPKIAVGMLALYTALKYDHDKLRLVAARDNIAHNLPQLYGFLGPTAQELPQLIMQPIAKAPTGYMQYLVETGVLSEDTYRDIVCTILPRYLITMRKTMTPEVAEQIIFSKRTY